MSDTDLLKRVIREAGLYSLSVTSKRLLHHINEHIENSCIVNLLPWIALSADSAAFLKLVSRLPLKNLSPEDRGVVYACELRLWLQGQRAEKPVLPFGAAYPKWVCFYLKNDKDIAYPTCLSHIRTVRTGRFFSLELTAKCLACGSDVVCTPLSDIFPWLPPSLHEANWMCPHCLAKAVWKRLEIRQALWDMYKNYFFSLEKNANGKLADPDVMGALLLANLLSPYAPVRFCSFRFERIGHLCFGAVRIAEQLRGTEELTLDFYGLNNDRFVSNDTLANILSRYFGSTVAAQQVYDAASKVGMNEITNTVLWATHTNTGDGRFDYPIHMNYEEEHKGLCQLETMGIPRGSRVCCLFVREDAYLTKVHPLGSDQGNEYRNSNINNYKLAVSELEKRGWYILRMGAAVKHPLTWTSDHIIDYASLYRNDFMDIWLLLHADLFITSASGPDTLPMMRNAHMIIVNAVDLWYLSVLHQNTLVLPKRMRYTKDDSVLALEDYLKNEAFFDTAVKNSKEKKIKYIENTPEEIYSAVCEKLHLMAGEASCDPKIEKLQAYYRSLTKNNYIHNGQPWGETQARFSTDFLLSQSI